METLRWTGIDAVQPRSHANSRAFSIKNCAVIFWFQNLTSVTVYDVRPLTLMIAAATAAAVAVVVVVVVVVVVIIFISLG